MLPFGETILSWRIERGLTQAALAKLARVPRPNLSAIERGDREVTLKTLRALALALDVTPGILVDGLGPTASAGRMTRATLERIAKAAARGAPLLNPREARIAARLRQAMSPGTSARTAASSARPSSKVKPDSKVKPERRTVGTAGRAADRAYLFLRSAEAPETIASLIQRATEHASGQ